MKKYTLIALALALIAGNIWYLYPKYQIFRVAPKFEATPEIQSLASQTEATVQASLISGEFSLRNFTSEPTPADLAVFESYYDKAKSEKFFRIKVWDSDYRVIWSNSSSLLNKRYPDNEEISKVYKAGKRVIEGKLNSLGGSDQAESLSENSFSNYIEIYVPIKDATDKIVGIVESYYVTEDAVIHYRNKLYQSAAISIFGSLILIGLAGFLMNNKKNSV